MTDRAYFPTGEKGSVAIMEEYRPHVTITCKEGVHVVPVSVIKKWIGGDLEPNKECVRRIIQEWAEGLGCDL